MKKMIALSLSGLTAIASAAVISGAMAPVASACSGVANGAGGGAGFGGGVQESCLPNGDKYHCESLVLFGIGGQNCFVIPVGDPRNPY